MKMSSSRRKFTAAELIPGQAYRVVTAFRDYDGNLHPTGEQWRFLEENFLSYEDGLTLQVEQDSQKRTIRLQGRDETQGRINNDFSTYVEEV